MNKNALVVNEWFIDSRKIFLFIKIPGGAVTLENLNHVRNNDLLVQTIEIWRQYFWIYSPYGTPSVPNR